jgi:hypothetical protein
LIELEYSNENQQGLADYIRTNVKSTSDNTEINKNLDYQQKIKLDNNLSNSAQLPKEDSINIVQLLKKPFESIQNQALKS